MQFHVLEIFYRRRWQSAAAWDAHYPSAILWFMQSHYDLIDFCKTEYPEYEPERCAAAIFYAKHPWTYDKADVDYTPELEQKSRSINQYILYFALLLYLMEIRLQTTLMLVLLVAINIYSFKDLFLYWPNSKWLGTDTGAYVIQGG
jgi:hypothetical protein